MALKELILFVAMQLDFVTKQLSSGVWRQMTLFLRFRKRFVAAHRFSRRFGTA
ncbi:hypothetical protein ABAC402_06400 [Asticcacaulis sp. AC402]|nr:hypothetical protein ABAC402_06400 [Asticcacaulis sp. AC402]